VRQGDVVMLKSGGCAKVVAFWSVAGADAYTVQLDVYTPAAGYMRWFTATPITRFDDVELILDAVAWGLMSADVIRVIPPFVAT
jgi:hypothetical protein